MTTSTSRFPLPHHGALNPAATPNVTTPGSFLNKPDVGGPLMFSSPDTPGMPAPSTKTAWDFLPEGWSVVHLGHTREGVKPSKDVCDRCVGDKSVAEFATAKGEVVRVIFPGAFKPITQLESARLGIVTPQMKRVAQREPHFEVLFPGNGAEAATIEPPRA